MVISKELQEKITIYEQAYFGLDEPVPFVNGLKIYPVMTKDYYNFYSNLPCLTMDKTVKKVKSEDELGRVVYKDVANPEGISMSNMAYLISCMENQEYGQAITAQVISMLELVLHEKNGLFCPECRHKIEQKEITAKFIQLQQSFTEDMDEQDKKIENLKFLQNISVCPDCQSKMREVFSIVNTSTKKLSIYNTELTPKQFDELVAVVTHQNILDYDGDKYIDPNLKKDMELKQRLENKNYSSPSLEKMLVCISISSPYTMEELKEKVTLRKFSLMLKTIDAKNYYYAQIQASMSGFVEFEKPPEHWIFGENKKDMSKEIMSMNDLQQKFASVT